MSTTVAPTETVDPKNLGTQIEKAIQRAKGVSKELQDLVVHSASKSNLFSAHVATDVRACYETNTDLMGIAKATATDARVKALKLFSTVSRRVRDETVADDQMVIAFDYMLKTLQPGSREFKTKDGKTFESAALDLKTVADTIGEEGKARLENANKNAVAAQAALDMAQAQYDQSKAEYERQLPHWLAALGLDDNIPRWTMLALYVPYDFLKFLAGRHEATVVEIKALIDRIKREEEAVNAARQKLEDALAEVEDREADANAILEYQSKIKTLAADVGDLASKLNVFQSIYDIVTIDCKNFRAKYVDLVAGKGDKAAVINEVLEEAKIFDAMQEGLKQFEVAV